MAIVFIVLTGLLVAMLVRVRDQQRPVSIRWQSADGLFARMIAAREEEEARHEG